jgi:hypothetical protein
MHCRGWRDNRLCLIAVINPCSYAEARPLIVEKQVCGPTELSLAGEPFTKAPPERWSVVGQAFYEADKHRQQENEAESANHGINPRGASWLPDGRQCLHCIRREGQPWAVAAAVVAVIADTRRKRYSSPRQSPSDALISCSRLAQAILVHGRRAEPKGYFTKALDGMSATLGCENSLCARIQRMSGKALRRADKTLRLLHPPFPVNTTGVVYEL